jgi:hypothetical protein
VKSHLTTVSTALVEIADEFPGFAAIRRVLQSRQSILNDRAQGRGLVLAPVGVAVVFRQNVEVTNDDVVMVTSVAQRWFKHRHHFLLENNSMKKQTLKINHFSSSFVSLPVFSWSKVMPKLFPSAQKVPSFTKNLLFPSVLPISKWSLAGIRCTLVKTTGVFEEGGLRFFGKSWVGGPWSCETVNTWSLILEFFVNTWFNNSF